MAFQKVEEKALLKVESRKEYAFQLWENGILDRRGWDLASAIKWQTFGLLAFTRLAYCKHYTAHQIS